MEQKKSLNPLKALVGAIVNSKRDARLDAAKLDFWNVNISLPIDFLL